jgi:hypothetical protein
MTRYPTSLILAVIAAALLLAGCSGPAGLDALRRDATPNDKPPAGVTLGSDISLDSVRLLVSRNGFKYFAAENSDGTRACVLVVSSDSTPDWIAGCGNVGSPQQIVGVSGFGGTLNVVLVANDVDARKLEADGWTKIHENILVGP